MEAVILVVLVAVLISVGVVIVLMLRSSQTVVDPDQQLAAFSHVSQQALAGQSQQLLQLAETRYGSLSQQTEAMLGSHNARVGEALDALGQRLASLERERSEATTSLTAMVRELAAANHATRDETAQLRAALRDSRVRGAWGEVQLRRVLELSGLQRHVDFVEQATTSTDGGLLRPDAVVHLPNDRTVVIDAKVPLDRFLEAAASDDPAAQRALLEAHARALSGHVHQLSQRRYSDHVAGAVDMVVLFVPGEPFLSAALDADPALFESAAAKGVVLTSPSSLLPLLRGIAVGWRERYADEQAAEIQRLGTELHERIGVFLDAYATVGARINAAADAYNKSLGSAESRLAVTARKLAEAGAGSRRATPATHEVVSVARTPVIALDGAGRAAAAIDSSV